jgi:hypothetical protein
MRSLSVPIYKTGVICISQDWEDKQYHDYETISTLQTGKMLWPCMDVHAYNLSYSGSTGKKEDYSLRPAWAKKA